MFNFFQRKKYLVDLLEGFVDIHNHILPGIDDGAKNVEESLGLLQAFKQIGVKKFICTPHIMNDYYGNDEKTITAAHDELLKALKTQEQLEDVRINFAAEYMLDTQYENLVKEKEILQLKENYLLLEISFFQAPLNLQEVVFNTFTQSYTPILAHPERYVFFHHKFGNYEELKKQGMPFQINALSLSNHYGPEIRKACFKLLEKGMVDFLATDTHRLQHIEKLKQIKLTEKQLALLIPVIERTNSVFG